MNRTKYDDRCSKMTQADNLLPSTAQSHFSHHMKGGKKLWIVTEANLIFSLR